MILIAYRRRGSVCWTHHFNVEPRNWAAFYRHARLWRQSMEYARVVRGEYVGVL